MEANASLPAIVIDNGSFTVKAGPADANSPRAVFRNLVGRPRQRGTMLSMGSKDSYVGDEGVSERSLIIKCPMENGIVVNWDDMEKIWHHTFYNELRVVPEDRPVLLTESPFNPAPNRLKTTQIMFETFNTPSTYLADRATLALLASGTATTGVVLQIGDGAAYAVPVCAGHAIPHAAQKISVNGCHITKYLSTLLEQESGVTCSTSAEREILRDIKEKICYVAKNFETEMEISVSSSILQKSYEMPSGEMISIGSPRFRCVEALFQPSFLGFDNDALSPQQAIFESIMKCDVEIQEQLWGNIVVSGASTLFQGFPDRINQEISSLVPSGHTPNIVAPEFREFAPWMGGCISALSPAFESMRISKKEYDEFGPDIYVYEAQVTPASVNPGAFRTQLWFNAPMRQCRLIEAAPVAAPVGTSAPAQASAAVRLTSAKKHYGKPETVDELTAHHDMDH